MQLFKTIALILCVLTTATQSHTAEVGSGEGRLDGLLKEGSQAAFIYWYGVSSPVGRYSFIKYSNRVCAIKIRDVGYKRGNINPQADLLEIERFAKYDFSVMDLSGKILSNGSGDVHLGGGTYNFFGFGFTNDRSKIQCDGIRLTWFYPATVAISDALGYVSQKEAERRHLNEYFYAATNFEKLIGQEVDAAKLNWFQVDGNRFDIKLDIDSLPGS